MKISLIRHGRPLVDYQTPIDGATFGRWLDEYEVAAIDTSVAPPEEIRLTLNDCRCLITSNAVRSILSAEVLDLRCRRITLADAREAPLPKRIFCPIRLRPITLTVIARVMWLLAIAPATESRRQAAARAHAFAKLLETLAADFGHVAVVGHGFFHRLTAKALRSSGWATIRTGSGYWSLSQLEKWQANQSLQTNPKPSCEGLSY